MKRLLAAGSGDIYQLCKAFRDAERGRWHNPEFTLLEWYRAGFDDTAMMTEVEDLVAGLLAPERDLPAAERLTYGEALRRHAGVDAHTASERDLAHAAAAARHRVPGRSRPRRHARSVDGIRGRAAPRARAPVLRARLSRPRRPRSHA